jgi:hypothetical protein
MPCITWLQLLDGYVLKACKEGIDELIVQSLDRWCGWCYFLIAIS